MSTHRTLEIDMVQKGKSVCGRSQNGLVNSAASQLRSFCKKGEYARDLTSVILVRVTLEQLCYFYSKHNAAMMAIFMNFLA